MDTIDENDPEVEKIFESDPAGYYQAMDRPSKNIYRACTRSISERSGVTALLVAQTAFDLALRNIHLQGSTSGDTYKSHIGYYLCDAGRNDMEMRLSTKVNKLNELTHIIDRHIPELYWFAEYGLSVILFLGTLWLLPNLSTQWPLRVIVFIALFTLFLEKAQIILMSVMSLAKKRRALISLDSPAVLPECRRVAVLIPCLIFNDKQIRDTVSHLEMLVNEHRELKLTWILLADLPDRDNNLPDHATQILIDTFEQNVRELNQRHNSANQGPVTLLLRGLEYNPQESLWMGWERKRGKIEHFYEFVRNGRALDIRCGSADRLSEINYILVLDDDTIIAPATVLRLLGAALHPLNKAVVDVDRRCVVRGYGVFQGYPTISSSSASRWRFPAFMFGQTGVPTDEIKIHSPFQSVFHQDIFMGKGLIDLDAYGAVLSSRLPENQLLNHDLIEGAYLRTATVPSCWAIDDVPGSLSAYSMRQHRWIRGDWQNLPWLLPRVRNRLNHSEPNPIGGFYRWTILENVRHSLQDIAILVLLLAAWSSPKNICISLLIATFAIWVAPAYIVIAAALFASKPSSSLFLRCRVFVIRYIYVHLGLILVTAALAYRSIIALDAIGKAIVRMWIGKKLLEWRSATELDTLSKRETSVIFGTSLASILAAIGISVALKYEPSDRWVLTLPILLLWASSWIIGWCLVKSNQDHVPSLNPSASILSSNATE